MFKLSEIQSWISADIVNGDANSAAAQPLTITGIAPLEKATSTDVAFFFSKHYQNDLLKSKAGVIVTGRDFVKPLSEAGIPQWKSSVFLACDNPYGAMATLSGKFSKNLSAHDHQVAPSKTEIHPSAVISPQAKLGKNVVVQAGSVIEAGAVIGDGVYIYPQCYVGPQCSIGEGSVLFPRVTLYEKTSVGKNCRLHSGVVLGADGFGYSPIIKEGKPVQHQKIYHLGKVILGDEVEIGANSTVDRGTLGDTVIHSFVKIDNQVQVGHNAVVGEGTVLCGGCGLAGSSSVGKFVVMGAQSGVGNQIHIGDYTKMGAYTGVGKDVAPGSEIMGIPARPIMEFYKVVALQSKLLRERKK